MSSEFRHRASLVLNVVLVVTAVVLALHRSAPAPAASALPGPNATPSTQEPRLPQYTETASAADQRRWLVDQLRAMGVPNKILARVVLADLDAGWNRHAAEVTIKCHGDPATMAALQLEIDKSLDAEMRAALGGEGFKQWDHENMLRESNRGKVQLTASETEAAYDLWKKLQQRELEFKEARVKGAMDEAGISEAYAKAYSEMNQQMKALLGEDRYAKSQQTDDGTAAANLRQDLAKANPSDSQFQELLTTQQQWNVIRSKLDKQFQDDPSSAAYAEQISALDEARDQEYRRVLGANVFDTLQKEQDIGYSNMKKYKDIWGLDDNKIDSVYGSMKYYEKAVQDYQTQVRALEAQGQSVDWAAVNKNLQQFAEQTQQTLKNYLGQASFNRMQQNGVFKFNQ